MNDTQVNFNIDIRKLANKELKEELKNISRENIKLQRENSKLKGREYQVATKLEYLQDVLDGLEWITSDSLKLDDLRGVITNLVDAVDTLKKYKKKPKK